MLLIAQTGTQHSPYRSKPWSSFIHVLLMLIWPSQDNDLPSNKAQVEWCVHNHLLQHSVLYIGLCGRNHTVFAEVEDAATLQVDPGKRESLVFVATILVLLSRNALHNIWSEGCIGLTLVTFSSNSWNMEHDPYSTWHSEQIQSFGSALKAVIFSCNRMTWNLGEPYTLQ